MKSSKNVWKLERFFLFLLNLIVQGSFNIFAFFVVAEFRFVVVLKLFGLQHFKIRWSDDARCAFLKSIAWAEPGRTEAYVSEDTNASKSESKFCKKK